MRGESGMRERDAAAASREAYRRRRRSGPTVAALDGAEEAKSAEELGKTTS